MLGLSTEELQLVIKEKESPMSSANLVRSSPTSVTLDLRRLRIILSSRQASALCQVSPTAMLFLASAEEDSKFSVKYEVSSATSLSIKYLSGCGMTKARSRIAINSEMIVASH